MAYRELGIYWGLATLKEEMRGGEQIPGRQPEVTGTMRSASDDSFFLTDIVPAAGSMPLINQFS